MTEVEAYRALSSMSRLQIMKVLYRKSLSVDEIARKLDLHPITVRHHLQSLEEAGFIETYEKRTRGFGRPKVYYTIAKKPKIVSFPRRHYQILSNFLLDTMQFLLGANKAKRILKKVGMEMGKDIAKTLEFEHNIKAWSPEEYEKFFVKGYLKESGTEPEIVKADGEEIVYRLHNCLFFELALKMPEMLCDTLHQSFHEGLSKAMGKGIKISRLTCMGRGDLYCEHVCEWKNVD